MVRDQRSLNMSTINRRQIRHRQGRQAPTFNYIAFIRDESQQLGGGHPGINDGRRRGDDQRIFIARSTKANSSSVKWHVIVFTTLGLLLGLMQVMYQNRKDSLFDTHPATIAIFITTLCIFCFTTAALLKSKASKQVEVTEEQHQPNNTGNYYFFHYHYQILLDILCRISAVVTTSCLVSVFIPDGLGWVMFVSCASIFCALVVAWNLFQRIFSTFTNSGQGAAGPNMV